MLVPFDTDLVREKVNAHDVDKENVINILKSLEEDKNHKVLVAAPNTKVLWRMLSQTSIINDLKLMGYDILHITSKHGAYVNQTKVRRDKFFQTLTNWGADDNKRFVVFHYSILSEGINVPGLSDTILLRNLPTIEMAQTIGRVIRLHNTDRSNIQEGKVPAGMYNFYKKKCGYVRVPLTKGLGTKTNKRVSSLINTIFNEGIPPISYAS
jgi:superfamily II DNA or RNA helicase